MSEEHYRGLERMYHAAPTNRYYEPVLKISKARSELTIPVKTDFFHAGSAVHGSVYFKALDDAAYFAVNSLEKEFIVLTVSFNLYLLRPVDSGVIRAEGRVVQPSRSMYTAEAVLYNEKEKEIARGSGTFVRSGIRLDSLPGYRQ